MSKCQTSAKWQVKKSQVCSSNFTTMYNASCSNRLNHHQASWCLTVKRWFFFFSSTSLKINCYAFVRTGKWVQRPDINCAKRTIHSSVRADKWQACESCVHHSPCLTVLSGCMLYAEPSRLCCKALLQPLGLWCLRRNKVQTKFGTQNRTLAASKASRLAEASNFTDWK